MILHFFTLIDSFLPLSVWVLVVVWLWRFHGAEIRGWRLLGFILLAMGFQMLHWLCDFDRADKPL